MPLLCSVLHADVPDFWPIYLAWRLFPLSCSLFFVILNILQCICPGFMGDCGRVMSFLGEMNHQKEEIHIEAAALYLV